MLNSMLIAATMFASATYYDPPTVEQVVRAPADFAGQKLVAAQALLSGTITTYDLGEVRKYYLTVGTARGRLQAGFFLAPPALADSLSVAMEARRNYSVNIIYKVQTVRINDFDQWHGVVTKVEFLDDDGRVVRVLPKPAK
jgi:hypothetical protein